MDQSYAARRRRKLLKYARKDYKNKYKKIIERINEEEEIWYYIPRKIKIGEIFCYPKNIECSSKGRIRNSHTHGIILPTAVWGGSSNFYRFTISLSKLGAVGHQKTQMLVSRLLALTVDIKKGFNNPSELYDEVHHLNGNCNDDHPENLAWVSHEENLWVERCTYRRVRVWRCDGEIVDSESDDNESDDNESDDSESE